MKILFQFWDFQNFVFFYIFKKAKFRFFYFWKTYFCSIFQVIHTFFIFSVSGIRHFSNSTLGHVAVLPPSNFGVQIQRRPGILRKLHLSGHTKDCIQGTHIIKRKKNSFGTKSTEWFSHHQILQKYRLFPGNLLVKHQPVFVTDILMPFWRFLPASCEKKLNQSCPGAGVFRIRDFPDLLKLGSYYKIDPSKNPR